MDKAALRAFRFNAIMCLMVAVTLSSLLGCGGTGSQPNYADLGLVEISGTIRLDGTSLANAHVEFVDEDGTFSHADADSQGRYRLRFDSNTYGTAPGKKIVRVRMRSPNLEDPSVDAEVPDENPTPVAASPIKIPECYNKRSVLVKQVTTAESNVDFDLKSQGEPGNAQR